MGQREQLRYTEQNTLLNALTYYMDVMQNTAVLDLNHSNVEVLKEQLRQTKDRFNVGEVTRTDVAQAEASLADAQANYTDAKSTLQTSIAQLPSGDRRSAEKIGAGDAGGQAAAPHAPARDRDFSGRESRDHRLSARR